MIQPQGQWVFVPAIPQAVEQPAQSVIAPVKPPEQPQPPVQPPEQPQPPVQPPEQPQQPVQPPEQPQPQPARAVVIGTPADTGNRPFTEAELAGMTVRQIADNWDKVVPLINS